jgi:O-antigen ligase
MRPVLGQPPVLWALGLFFLCLGFTARFDIPLALLAVTAALAFAGAAPPAGGPAWREHWPLVLFVLVAALATGFSRDRPHSLAVQPQLLPALLCYAVISTFALRLEALRFIGLALLCSGIVTALLVLTAESAHHADPLKRVVMMGSPLLIVPNDVLMLSVIAPLALGAAWGANRWWQWMAAVYFGLALFVCTSVQSRQAVILLVLGVIATVGLMRPRWSIPLLLAGAIITAAVDAMMGWPLARKIFLFPRLYVWQAAWGMFLDRPWLGQGPGTFSDLYYPFVEKAGYVVAQLEDRRTMPWAHSLYLEQLAERGIAGALVLLALLASTLLRLLQGLRRVEGDPQRGIAAGLLASMLVFLLAGIAETSLLRLWVVVLMLVLAACSIALARMAGCDGVGKTSVAGC